MATVVKNFRIKSGLIVEGTSGTINGHNILTESTSGDQYILNLVGGATLVKSVDTDVFNIDNAGNLTINANTFDSYGSASAAQTAAAADATNKANAALSDAQSFATTAANNAKAEAATDATTKANNAQSAAEATASADATSKANAAQAAAEATASADATSKANAAEAAAIAAAALDATSKANAAEAAANLYTDGAVSALVDSAPELLNTLNELAAALGDSPDTITNLTTLVGTKADTSYVNSEISDLDTAAQGYASAAQTAAEATASADATSKANAAQAAAEATAQAALDDVLDGTTAFTEINVNSEAKQIAATSASLGSVVVTAYEWPKADYRSGKFLVKIDNGTHNEISEILVTLDSSDNVAITEYAIVGTNGSRGTITASVSGANVQLRVDPVNDSTIKVTGTLLK
jgi:small-conductance mechanosensitive channel